MTAGAPVSGRWPWWRLGGIFGIAWFGLFLLGGVVLQGEPPAFDTPIAEIREFFAGNGTQYLLGDYLLGLAFWFGFLPFTVCLGTLLGRAEGGPQIASRLVLAGGLATVVVGGNAPVFTNSLALNDLQPGIADSAAQGLLYAHTVALADLGMPASLFVLACAWAIWSTHALWRWLAVLALIDGILLGIGASFPIAGQTDGPLFLVRFLSFIGLAQFVLLTSICILTRKQPPSER